VLQATVKDKVAYIDISESLAKRSRTKEILAIGQLVFTAYYAGAKNGIEISVAGIAQKLLLPDHKFVSNRNRKGLRDTVPALGRALGTIGRRGIPEVF